MMTMVKMVTMVKMMVLKVYYLDGLDMTRSFRQNPAPVQESFCNIRPNVNLVVQCTTVPGTVYQCTSAPVYQCTSEPVNQAHAQNHPQFGEIPSLGWFPPKNHFGTGDVTNSFVIGPHYHPAGFYSRFLFSFPFFFFLDPCNS